MPPQNGTNMPETSGAQHQGQYTRRYFNTNLAYRPTKDDLHGFAPPDDDDRLINHELIPLSREMVDGVITELGEFATRVRDAIDGGQGG